MFLPQSSIIFVDHSIGAFSFARGQKVWSLPLIFFDFIDWSLPLEAVCMQNTKKLLLDSA